MNSLQNLCYSPLETGGPVLEPFLADEITPGATDKIEAVDDIFPGVPRVDNIIKRTPGNRIPGSAGAFHLLDNFLSFCLRVFSLLNSVEKGHVGSCFG